MTKIHTIMLHFVVKTGKIGFWILLPLFLISNTGVEYELPLDSNIKAGNYRLKATGALDKVFSGEIFFIEKIDSLSTDGQFKRIELKLDSVGDTVNHNMGFVLSRNVFDADSLIGNYIVSAKSAGISNSVDGVFGFADIGILGEQPFFADYGRIRITAMADGLLYGNIKMAMRNFDGKSIDISGNFVAKKKK